MSESPENKVIQVPTWFLKLSGWLTGTFALGAMSWAAWMTVNVIQIKASVDTHDKNTARIEALQKDVNDLRIEIFRERK